MKPTLAFPVPETPEFDVTAIRNLSEKYLDIPYADLNENQIMDLYLPKVTGEKFPLIIYIHEGAFIFGSKRDRRMETLFEALNQGFAIASIEYRKADQATWPAPIYDVKAAIRFLRANAEKYHLDESRFAVWGMSAGAYYGAISAVTNGNPGFEDLTMGNAVYSSEIQAVVDLCGACSGFHDMDKAIRENGFGRANHDQSNSPESILMGNPLQEIPELCSMASPITYIGENTPPFFIMHCLTDPVVPVQQSKRLVEAIQCKAGEDKVTAIFTEAEADHEKPDYNTKEIVEQALAFLNKVLPSNEMR